MQVAARDPLRRPSCARRRAADPTQRLRPRYQLVDALADGGLADLGRLRDSPDPAVSQDPGLSPHQQTTLALVQVREQHREYHGELITSLL